MDIAINIVTAVCLVLLSSEVIYVIANTVIKKRPERIAFIRSFKKGKCVAIFLMAIPLFFMAYLYSGTNFMESLFSAITHVVGLVILKFNLDDIPGLLAANAFYRGVVYYCCVLVTINAALFALSLTSQRIWAWLQAIKSKLTKKDKLYIFGYNKDSLAIYASDGLRNKTVVDKISDNDCASLYIGKVGYISCRNFDGAVDNIVKSAAKKNNKITVVINTEDDEKNIKIARLFIDRIEEAGEPLQSRFFDRLDIHVFGDPRYEAVYDDLVSKSLGCVHYKNKYRMIAMNFVDKYPLTKFMDERHIDYTTSLIKPDVDINVCMIGFGKPNQQIFLTSVANNQFLTRTDKGLGLKAVNYHIFDKMSAENNKSLNHSYYRLKNECADINPKDYLPMPELPAHEEYYHMDINEPSFYNAVRKIVTAKKTDKNFIIISFESDLENIDMAQKLLEKSREWGADDLVIFVRVRTSHDEIISFARENVFFIGDEKQCVYNISEITGDGIFRMAQMRNEIYDLEYRVTTDKKFVLNEKSVLESRASSRRNWFVSKSRLERESSLYSCLSLRSKLNLMGLDYCSVNDNDSAALTEAEYIKWYAGDDAPDTHSLGLEVDGKKIVKYTLDFPESRRKNLAILEHLRWNSFMISKGIIPADKERILNEMTERNGKIKHTNGKNYSLRRHGNLTTFDGLVEFRQLVANRDNESEADYDVIKYDYQLLDDAYWLLSKNGYKIIKKV